MSLRSTHYSAGTLTSIEDLTKVVESIEESNAPFGFDIETGYEGPDKANASLHPEEGFIVGFSVAPSEAWARYIPMRHDFAEDFNLDPQLVAPLLWRMLRTGNAIIHNAAFEISFLAAYFEEYLPHEPELVEREFIIPFLADTMLLAKATAKYERVGLKDMTKAVFLSDQASLESLVADIPKTKMQFFRFNPLSVSSDVVSYACDDSAWCLSLYYHLIELVDPHGFIPKLMHSLVPILYKMSHRPGLYYDWQKMEEYLREAELFLEVLEREIKDSIFERTQDREASEINFNSPAQVSKLYYDTLGLPEIRDNKTGKLTTNAKALERLAKHDVIVERIIEYKEVKKLISSYLKKHLNEFQYDPSGFTHASHNQVRVNSGRLAVSSPSYQQSVKKKQYTSGIHSLEVDWPSLMIAPKGQYILSFDFGQQEYRILAGLSGDPNLLDTFESGVDIHSATAAQVFGVPISEVTSQQRTVAKTINFALLYGQGVESTASQLGISIEEAEAFMDKYFSAFTEVRPWMKDSIDFGYEHGYVTTYFGRKVPIFEFDSSQKFIVSKGERLCVNAKCQGTGADITELAMIRAVKRIKEDGLDDKVKLVMNIHDALYFYVDKSIDPYYLSSILRPCVEIQIPGFPRFISEWHYGIDCSEESSIEIPDEDFSSQGIACSDFDSLYYSDLEAKEREDAGERRDVSFFFSAMPNSIELEEMLQYLSSIPGSDSLTFVLPEGVKKSSLQITYEEIDIEELRERVPTFSDMVVK